MADLILKGSLNLTGKLDLASTDGGKIKVDDNEVLVATSDKPYNNSGTPVPLPPNAPVDTGINVYLKKTFNSDVTANGVAIVTMGIIAQGNTPTWPGLVLPSINNLTVRISTVQINVVNDKSVTLPNGGMTILDISNQ